MIGLVVSTMGWIAMYAGVAVVGLMIPLASAVAAYQESKIWSPKTLPSITWWGAFKIWTFNVVWMTGCLVGSFMILPRFFARRLLSSSSSSEAHVQREAHCVVERLMAHLLFDWFIGPVVVEGQHHLLAPQSHDEGLPSPFAVDKDLPQQQPQPLRTPACVYICNHASHLDVAAVYFLRRRFKWISKSSVQWLPGVGLLMTLSQHVFIDRKRGGKSKNATQKSSSSSSSSSSVSNLYKQANVAIQSGIPMLVFPQGTRRIAEKMPFKDGAFNIAMENNTTLVPISIRVPHGIWNRPYPFVRRTNDPPLVLTVHPPIPVKRDANKEELKTKTLDIIYSALDPLPDDKDQTKKEK